MTKEVIITKVKSLNLPVGSYIVYGSGPLAAAGLRQANDIDLLVSPTMYAQLESAGWKRINKGPNDTPLTHDVFEAHASWAFSTYCPTLEHLLASATIVDVVPFASLEEVKKWKAASVNPKNMADIELINQHLAS